MYFSEKNEKLFAEAKALKLKPGQYAITASAPLGVRGVREMADIDILVTDEYWEELKLKGRVLSEDGVQKLKLSNNIEVLFSGSFKSTERMNNLPSIEEQIEKAETIDGLSFVCLEYLRLFKSISGRDKDKRDLELIDNLTI